MHIFLPAKKLINIASANSILWTRKQKFNNNRSIDRSHTHSKLKTKQKNVLPLIKRGGVNAETKLLKKEEEEESM